VAQTRNDSAFTNTSSTHIGLLFERNSVVLTSSHQELVCVMCAPGSYKVGVCLGVSVHGWVRGWAGGWVGGWVGG